MPNKIESIALGMLVPHPDNPNRMSKSTFAKLVRNIERTGRYEPLVVRPCPKKDGYFQIISGHHRCKALRELGYETADAVVWDIDDEQADILLATLNRLTGSDVLAKKLALLRRLNANMRSRELAKFLPQTARQIERLANFKLPTAPARIDATTFAMPLVFFLNRSQQRTINKALSLAQHNRNERTKAARKAAALTEIARHYLGAGGGLSRPMDKDEG